MTTAHSLWPEPPRLRPLHFGEQLTAGQTVYIDGMSPLVFVGWMLCGVERFALLDCGRCPVQHVAFEQVMRVEAVADEQPAAATSPNNRGTRTRRVR